MATYSCRYCDRPFEYTGWRARQYCSRACANRAHMAAKKAEPKEMSACEICGAPYYIAPGRRGTRSRFCSRRCKGEARRGKPSPHTLVNGRSGTGRSGFRPDLGHYCRSRWEANYARYLLATGHTYEYEPTRFVITLADGTSHGYTPDFLVDGAYYVEVKGWMRADRRQAEVIAVAQATLPLTLILVDGPAYQQIADEHAATIDGWEYLGDPKPELPKRACPTCGKLVTSMFLKTRYCSRACFGATCRKPKHTVQCRTCGREMEVPPWDAGRSYCSRACFAASVRVMNETRPRGPDGRFL